MIFLSACPPGLSCGPIRSLSGLLVVRCVVAPCLLCSAVCGCNSTLLPQTTDLAASLPDVLHTLKARYLELRATILNQTVCE